MMMTREEFEKRYKELKENRKYWADALDNARSEKYEDIALKEYDKAVEECREFRRSVEII